MTTPSLGQIEVIGSTISVGTSEGQDITVQDSSRIRFSASAETARSAPHRTFEGISEAVKGNAHQILGIYLPNDSAAFPIHFQLSLQGGMVIPSNYIIGIVPPGGKTIDTSKHPHIITIGSAVQQG